MLAFRAVGDIDIHAKLFKLASCDEEERQGAAARR